MPSKVQHDANLMFLYTCLQKSDYKTIDFNAVGAATNLNAPAARMRFTRLKKAIESGSVAASPPAAATTSITGGGGQAKQKRKASHPKVKKEIVSGEKGGVDMELNSENDAASGIRMGMRPRSVKVKVESDEYDDGLDDVAKYGTSGGSEYDGGGAEDDDDEEDDDIPLMKKRKAPLSVANVNQSKKNKVVPSNVNASYQPADAATVVNGPNTINAPNAAKYVDGSIMRQGDLDSQLGAYEAATLSPNAHPDPMILENNENIAPVPRPLARGSNRSPITTNVIAKSIQLQSAMDVANPKGPAAVAELFECNGQIVFPPTVPPAPPHDRPPTSRYTRYPGLEPQSSNSGNLIGYRLPSITVTDTEPYSPRNLLDPGSIVASGRMERDVNVDLFGPGSSAFQPRAENVFGDGMSFVNAPPTAGEDTF